MMFLVPGDEPDLVDWQVISGNKPLVLEIGCGNGHFLVEEAKQNPDVHYIGIEIKKKRLIRCREKQVKHGIENITWICGEGSTCLEGMFSDGSLKGIYLLFNDPWPKARHHKRRLTQGIFFDLLAQKLDKRGWFYFVTDHEEFFEWTKEIAMEKSAFTLEELDDLDQFMQTLFAIKWQQEQRNFFGFKLDLQ
jgi:tRNA (guanine-N7-)-methyltransferase